MKRMMCSVLIVEDEKIERDSLYEILNERFKGMLRLYTAKNGREALEYYQRVLPDVVLTDIDMPIMNGLEAIEAMKQFHHHTIYLTGKA